MFKHWPVPTLYHGSIVQPKRGVGRYLSQRTQLKLNPFYFNLIVSGLFKRVLQAGVVAGVAGVAGVAETKFGFPITEFGFHLNNSSQPKHEPPLSRP